MTTPLNKLNLDKHVSSRKADDLKTILKPLTNESGIIHFGYKRLYHNKEELFLTTTPECVEVFCKEKLYNIAFCGNPTDYQEGYYFSNHLQGCNIIDQAERERAHVDHQFFIIKHFSDFVEFAFFGGAIENFQINNYYVNHLDRLENFVTQFKEDGDALIQEALTDLITWPNSAGDFSDLISAPTPNQKINSSHPYQIPTESKHLTLLKLSNRELECLHHLNAGLSNKQIADKMFISKRTIDKHIENMRKKLNCRNRIELLTHTNRIA